MTTPPIKAPLSWRIVCVRLPPDLFAGLVRRAGELGMAYNPVSWSMVVREALADYLRREVEP